MEGNYVFPENSHPVSAVYWFQCVPKCKFLQPITLEIEHCAKHKNLQALSFVKARSVENLPEAKFNRALGCCGTNHGVFPNHSTYGFLQLDGFCGYGIIQEGSEDRQYRANLYYLPQSVDQCQIHFTVLWNTEAHYSVSCNRNIKCQYYDYTVINYSSHIIKQIINNHYLQQNAEVGPDSLVEFDSEIIHLDIPKEGIITEDGMWKIFPMVFPPKVNCMHV